MFHIIDIDLDTDKMRISNISLIAALAFTTLISTSSAVVHKGRRRHPLRIRRPLHPPHPRKLPTRGFSKRTRTSRDDEGYQPAPVTSPVPSPSYKEENVVDLTPIVLGLVTFTGLTFLFPTYVNLETVKRKKRSSDEVSGRIFWEVHVQNIVRLSLHDGMILIYNTFK